MATIQAARGAPATQDTATTHPYTCNTCQVAFRNSDLQKGHMRSDWHRYNLKRRVASLPPISSETFTDKVLQSRASATAEADRAGFHKECKTCHRTYYSENSYQNHIESQNHKAKEAAAARAQNGAAGIDDASSMMSSTFSLGESVPVSTIGADSDAEDEFNNIVQGMKKTDLKDSTSPVDRPANPTLSAAAQRESSKSSATPSIAAASSSATPTPSQSNGTAPVLTLRSCLFCNYESPTPPLSVVHMERIHGMFIPEKQYLVDLEGLLTALQQRVQEYHECLTCGKAKVSAVAAQTHMRDKAHCQIPYHTEEEQLEIGEYYDFRSTYSDPEGSDDESVSGEDKPNGGAKLGSKKESKNVDSDDNQAEGDDNGDGWETDSMASSLDSADLTAVPLPSHEHQYQRLPNHRHHSSTDTRPHHQQDGWHSHSHKPTHAAFYDEYELHLPSGKSVGHRAFNRYFRQNLHSYPSAAEREKPRLAIENGSRNAADISSDEDEDEDENENADAGLSNDNNALARQGDAGNTHDRALAPRSEMGMAGVSDLKKDEVQRAAKRSRRQEQAASRRIQWATNKAANHQKHFRDPMLQ